MGSLGPPRILAEGPWEGEQPGAKDRGSGEPAASLGGKGAESLSLCWGDGIPTL